MNKKIQKIALLLGTIFGFFTKASFVLALEVHYPTINIFGQVFLLNDTSSFPEYVCYFSGLGTNLALFISVIVIAFGGVLYTLAFVKGKFTDEGKSWVKAGITGLLVIISTSLIAYTLNPNLTTCRLGILSMLNTTTSGSFNTPGATATTRTFKEIPLGNFTETLLTREIACYAFDPQGNPVDGDPLTTGVLEPTYLHHDRADCFAKIIEGAEKKAQMTANLSYEITKLMNTCTCDGTKCDPKCNPDTDCVIPATGTTSGTGDDQCTDCQGECPSITGPNCIPDGTPEHGACRKADDYSRDDCCPVGIKNQIEQGPVAVPVDVGEPLGNVPNGRQIMASDGDTGSVVFLSSITPGGSITFGAFNADGIYYPMSTNAVAPLTLVDSESAFYGNGEWVFYIEINGNKWRSGPAYRNSDNQVHANVSYDGLAPDGTTRMWTVAFEDGVNGGDRDFNDLVLSARTSAGSTPFLGAYIPIPTTYQSKGLDEFRCPNPQNAFAPCSNLINYVEEAYNITSTTVTTENYRDCDRCSNVPAWDLALKDFCNQICPSIPPQTITIPMDLTPTIINKGKWEGLNLWQQLQYFKEKKEQIKRTIQADKDKLDEVRTALASCYWAVPSVELAKTAKTAAQNQQIILKSPETFTTSSGDPVNVSKYCKGFTYANSSCLAKCSDMCPISSSVAMNCYAGCKDSGGGDASDSCIKTCYESRPCTYASQGPQSFNTKTFSSCITTCQGACIYDCQKRYLTSSSEYKFCASQCSGNGSCASSDYVGECTLNSNKFADCGNQITDQGNSDYCTSEAYLCKNGSNEFAGYQDCTINPASTFSSSFLFQNKTSQKCPDYVMNPAQAGTICRSTTSPNSACIYVCPETAKCPASSNCPKCPCDQINQALDFAVSNASVTSPNVSKATIKCADTFNCALGDICSADKICVHAENTTRTCTTNSNCRPEEVCQLPYNNPYAFTGSADTTGSETGPCENNSQCGTGMICQNYVCISATSGNTSTTKICVNKTNTNVKPGVSAFQIVGPQCSEESKNDDPLTFYCEDSWWLNPNRPGLSPTPLGKQKICPKKGEVPAGQTVDDARNWADWIMNSDKQVSEDIDYTLNLMKKIGDAINTNPVQDYCKCQAKWESNTPVCTTDCLHWYSPPVGAMPSLCGTNFIPCAGGACQQIENYLSNLWNSNRALKLDFIDFFISMIIEPRSDILKELTYSRNTMNSCSVTSNAYEADNTLLLNCTRAKDEIISPADNYKIIYGNQLIDVGCYGQDLGREVGKSLTDNWFCCEARSPNQ